MSPALPYREFYYPLNVFMYVLSQEERSVGYLHYGLFESSSDTIGEAQERATNLLLARVPPPPGRVLEVGIGLGTTLARLTRSGYDAVGITPDEKQIAMVRERHGNDVRAHCSSLETFAAEGTYDCLLFQESAQYIDSAALFGRARDLTKLVVVADEFALRPLDRPGALHSLARFLEQAASHDFELSEEVDVSEKAAPTIDYFLERLPKYRDHLVAALDLKPQQIDDLIASGEDYRALYHEGAYGYRLLTLRAR